MSAPSSPQAVRASYDTVAEDYAEHFGTELAARPFERAMLAAFTELVLADEPGPVADIGCGPGRVTAHLHALGLTSCFGVDLSPGMVATARRRHPGIRFDEGTMTALDLPDAGLAGALAWYSLVHTPPAELPGVLGELARVLRPGGHLLVAVKVGDESMRLERAYGRPVSLDVFRFPPDRVTELLGSAGLPVQARLVREPDEAERSPQAFLLARRVAAA